MSAEAAARARTSRRRGSPVRQVPRTTPLNARPVTATGQRRACARYAIARPVAAAAAAATRGGRRAGFIDSRERGRPVQASPRRGRRDTGRAGGPQRTRRATERRAAAAGAGRPDRRGSCIRRAGAGPRLPFWRSRVRPGSPHPVSPGSAAPSPAVPPLPLPLRLPPPPLRPPGARGPAPPSTAGLLCRPAFRRLAVRGHPTVPRHPALRARAVAGAAPCPPAPCRRRRLERRARHSASPRRCGWRRAPARAARAAAASGGAPGAPPTGARRPRRRLGVAAQPAMPPRRAPRQGRGGSFHERVGRR